MLWFNARLSAHHQPTCLENSWCSWHQRWLLLKFAWLELQRSTRYWTRWESLSILSKTDILIVYSRKRQLHLFFKFPSPGIPTFSWTLQRQNTNIWYLNLNFSQNYQRSFSKSIIISLHLWSLVYRIKRLSYSWAWYKSSP